MVGLFQSTLPMRGATIAGVKQANLRRISIHAPHAGSDFHHETLKEITAYFNPRSPCGERRGCLPAEPKNV